MARPCLANLRDSARITKILLLCIEQIRRGEARLVAKTVLNHLLDPKDMTRIRCSRPTVLSSTDFVKPSIYLAESILLPLLRGEVV
jgi:hypothetical protein